jgi:hypothetical protein
MVEKNTSRSSARLFAVFMKACFATTPSERFAITVVFLLFLLGLFLKYCWISIPEKSNSIPEIENVESSTP